MSQHYELLECPVCHGEPFLGIDESDVFHPCAIVRCNKCGLELKRRPIVGGRENAIETAVKDWNESKMYRSSICELKQNIRIALSSLDAMTRYFRSVTPKCGYPKCEGCEFGGEQCNVKAGLNALNNIRKNPTSKILFLQ